MSKVKTLLPGQSMDRTRYNQLARRVNQLTNIKGSGGIRVNKTPNGTTIIGSPAAGESINHISRMTGDFQQSLGNWGLGQIQFNLFGATLIVDPEIGDYVLWRHNKLAAGNYHFYVCYDSHLAGGTIEFIAFSNIYRPADHTDPEFDDFITLGTLDTQDAEEPRVARFDVTLPVSLNYQIKAIVTVAGRIYTMVYIFKKTR